MKWSRPSFYLIGTLSCVSILPLLSYHGFVSATLLDGRAERRRACSQCRNHLVTHANSQLRPVVRTENGCEGRSASDEEHARAYLQHDAHAETIIRFFLAQPYATGRAMRRTACARSSRATVTRTTRSCQAPTTTRLASRTMRTRAYGLSTARGARGRPSASVRHLHATIIWGIRSRQRRSRGRSMQ